ncbi:phage major capsid protein, HK97 family [Kaistia soli DSM 19436]|uniref:Phage major capsid protein, HK97 family n=1 Tax=Kaistia soli DSM 19436 TaxID=1122133 RepID=A0A1M4Y9R8_9HYPH|nr:phage major capsid protein [Kaistia soli]SHF02242.1 phage major capsid protein, HK97 family [Kaistia soli DSM 19436]
MGKYRNTGLLAVVTAALLVAVVVMVGIDGSTLHHAIASIADPHAMSVASLAALAPLREKRVALVKGMKDMLALTEAENRDLSAEEQTSYDGLKAEKDALDKRIARLDELMDADAALDAVVPAAGRRSGIEAPRRPNEAKKDFENFGEFMNAVRFNPNDQRLNFVESAGRGEDDLSAEMRMDTNTQGGFMVPPQLRQTLMSVPPQDALVRPRANVIPAGSPPDAGITMPALDQTGSNPGNMFGGMTFNWIEEGGEKPETDAKLREVTLTPHEIAGFVTVTDKLLRNWQAANSFVESLMRAGVIAAEDYAFLQGSGIGKPLGIINAGVTRWINRATANHVAYLDLVTMASRLLMRGVSSPVWSMPQSALVDIATMTDPEGHYIWQANAKDGFAGTLLGYPVRWNNRAPALGSKGDIILADWSYYLIKDGSGPFVAASEHVKFTSNKTVIKIFWNVDGSPWLTAPIKEENGYEVSPFVGLDVPA